jgi:hypothetical protein
MSPPRWPRSPSHGKCSRRFCGSWRNCDRSHHQRGREVFDGDALKGNRREECVRMPGKMARADPSTTVRAARRAGSRLPSRRSCRKAGKARIFTPVRESSGESRLEIRRDNVQTHKLSCRVFSPLAWRLVLQQARIRNFFAASKICQRTL